MNQALLQFGTSAAFGLYWPTWLAAIGIAVFCLLGLYAAFLFFAQHRRLARFRFLLPPTLRGRIMLGIILAATLPAISLALVLMERTTSERLDRTADLLKSQTASFAKMADYFLDQSIADLKTSATDISVDDRDVAQESLYRFHRALPGFLSLLLVDIDGLVVASTEFGTQRVTALPVDTDYVSAPLQSGATFISDVNLHPGDDATLTAALSAPVIDADGLITGALIGYYNFAGFTRMEKPILTKSDIESILVDGTGKVLFVTELAGTVTGEQLSGKSLLANAYIGDAKLFSFTHADVTGGPQRRYLATGHTLRSGCTWCDRWKASKPRCSASIRLRWYGLPGRLLSRSVWHWPWSAAYPVHSNL